MSEPTQTCELCGLVEVVTPYGRGFPPDAAKRRLAKRCKANGCPSKPRYLAGVSPALRRLIGGQ
jgi:hypothetical protein